MGTHNIGFYEEMAKIIFSIIIKYHQICILSVPLVGLFELSFTVKLYVMYMYWALLSMPLRIDYLRFALISGIDLHYS